MGQQLAVKPWKFHGSSKKLHNSPDSSCKFISVGSSNSWKYITIFNILGPAGCVGYDTTKRCFHLFPDGNLDADVEILGFEALAGRRTIQSIQTLTDLKSETGLYGLSGILVMCFHSCQWVDFYR